MKKSLFLIFLFCLLLFPTISNASDTNLNLDYPTITIPGVGEITLSLDMELNTLIAWLYYFIIGIAGISAFVMLVWGGVEWMTSAGNPSKITSAKDRMTSALLGLLIILASWLILQVINPELVILTMPE